MKRFLIVAALLLVAAQAHAQGKFILDYKGLAFGKEISDPKYMMKDHQQGELVFYTRYGDERSFQGVPLKDQFYGYYQGKLCLVLFSAQGPSSYNALKAYFDANYGPAMQPKVNIKQFTYPAGDVEIQMSYDDARKVVEVSYVYRPLMRQFMPAVK